MRIADLAKELKIKTDYIEQKLKDLKLRSKDGGEITAGVEMILRDALAEEGIGKKIVEEEEKPVKKAAKPVAKKTAVSKTKAADKEQDVKKTVKKAVKKTVKKEAKKESVREVIIEAKHRKDVPVPQIVVVKAEPPKQDLPKPPVKPVVTVTPLVPVVEVKETPQPPKQPSNILGVVTHKIEPPTFRYQQHKNDQSKTEQPKDSSKPVIDINKIDIPTTPPFEPVKKKQKYDEPFVAVKPLAKKRRRPEDGGSFGNRDHKPSTTIDQAVTPEPVIDGPLKDIEIQLPVTVGNLAVKLGQKTNVVLKKLLDTGIFANINQNLDEATAQKVAAAFGYNVVKGKTQEEVLIDTHEIEKDDPATLKPRAPVVTFMGHVDHGKTSLLDRIRSTKIADREHGGITQHIGAYSVKMPKGRITFLDTPGHEAFTAMRSRGAHITDIVVLVVAADEGIMPQTVEAIDHARAANVPIVVALNKMDKKTADPDRVKKQLIEHDLMPEDWGGKTVVAGVSAQTGQGIDELLELILLESELLDLKANPDKKAAGIVIEAHISKGRGSVASMIVQTGTLREGDHIVVGPYYGKVKAMFDDLERPIKEAGPSSPVEILGLSEVPAAGEKFYAMADEKTAREIAQVRADKVKAEKLSGTARVSLEELYAQIKDADIKELKILIKADVQGSLEAIKEALSKIPTNEVKLRIMHAAVGDVNSSDVVLAMASQAVIIAFCVAVDVKARGELEKSPVDVREYRIIYDAVEDVRKALEGMLAPRLKRNFLGRVEVRQVFKLSKGGIIAGSYVQKGKIRNRLQIEVIRNGAVAYTGKISSLKRFKDDVKEVGENFECGIGIDGFPDVAVGDIIEAFDIESIARKL